jgi:RNA polymerase sigma-70 factor, ECF subfamily
MPQAPSDCAPGPVPQEKQPEDLWRLAQTVGPKAASDGLPETARNALNELIMLFTTSVYAFLRYLSRDHDVAEELTQQTFLVLCSKAGDPTLKKRGTVRQWLLTVAANLFRRNRTKHRRRQKLLDDYLAGQGGDQAPPDDTVDQAELMDRLYGLIEELPEEHRAPLISHCLVGMSHGQIAAALNIPIGTVKSRLNAARARLLTCIEQQAPELITFINSARASE